jgi:hypothetical protein
MMSEQNPLELKILDYRMRALTDEDAKQILNEVGSGKYWQIQVRCDSQMLCDAVRAKLFRFAMEDGRQFEMTILGGGAAVGVKMHIPPQYVWDAKTRRDVPREQWVKEHPGTA